jgi:hypothetical protein
MPAFCSSLLTPNGTFDPLQDKMTPQCRSLSLGGMCSAGALSGTTGVQTEVISGDWQQKVLGSATVNIDGHSDTTVQGDVTERFNQNCSRTVTSNDTCKVHGNSTSVVNGSEHRTTVGPTLETKMGEHTQVHQAAEHHQDQTQFTRHASDYSAYGFRFEADGLLFNPIGGHVDLVGRRVTAGLQIFESCLNKTEFDDLEEKVNGLKEELAESTNKVRLMEQYLAGLSNKVSGLYFIQGPLVLDGPPAVGIVLDALVADVALCL